MAFIETIPARQSSGEVKSMYERQQKAYGYVPNYAKVFSHRPEVLARWGRLLAEIRRPMDDRLFELATFAAAIVLKSSACSLAHGQKLAEMDGKDNVLDLAEGGLPKSYSDADVAVVNFARKVAIDASSVVASDVDSLKSAGYSDAQIFDIATTVAGRAFLTKLLDALGVDSDASVHELDDEFRKALMVGRTKISDAPEVL